MTPTPRAPSAPVSYARAVRSLPALNTYMPNDGGYTSWLFPTRRFGFDAFACFYASVGTDDLASECSMWLALDARRIRVVLFVAAPVAAVFGATPTFQCGMIEHLQAYGHARTLLQEMMEAVSLAFFASVPAPDRSAVVQTLQVVFGREELKALHVAFPDFFDWLLERGGWPTPGLPPPDCAPPVDQSPAR